LRKGGAAPTSKSLPLRQYGVFSSDKQFYACVANQTFSRGLIRLVKNWATPLR